MNKIVAAVQGNCWEFDPGRLVVFHREHPRAAPYEIDLETITTSAATLDWIVQVSQKAWSTPKVVGDLVQLLDAILDLQHNYCSGGLERGPVNVKQLSCT